MRPRTLSGFPGLANVQVQEAGRDTARIIDPNWPKRVFHAINIMLMGAGEGGYLPSWHPSFLLVLLASFPLPCWLPFAPLLAARFCFRDRCSGRAVSVIGTSGGEKTHIVHFVYF